MFVSKLDISDKLSNQKSLKGRVLEWMIDHPKSCTDTNAKLLGKTMVLSGLEATAQSAQQTIQSMVRNQMIWRYGNNRRARFVINFMHKDIPGYVLDKAPEDERTARVNAENNLKKGQHLDDVGCVVTQSKAAEPTDNAEEEEESQEETVVPIIVMKKRNGNSTSVSITLNVNLNI